MNRLRMLVPVAVAATSGLLLTACGSSSSSGTGSTASPSGSGSSSAPTATTPTSTASSLTATASGPAPTKAQLQKINLQASDLPATYKATAPGSDSDDSSLDSQLAACTGVHGAPESHKVATAVSDDFELDNVTVSSDFSSYRSAGDVTADVAQLKSPKINQCLNTAFKTVLAKSAGAGTTVTAATIQLTQGSGGGPSNVVALATGVVDLTVNGQKAAVYLGVAFITGPQLDGSVTFVGANKPLDTATQTSVLKAVATRAQHP